MLTGLHDLQRKAGLPTGRVALEQFWDRPYWGVPDSVSELLLDAVTDPMVRQLPVGLGSIEQWVDNSEVLTDPRRRVHVVRSFTEALLNGRD